FTHSLVQCSCAAVRKKASYLNALSPPHKAQRGPKKAMVVVAASILTAIYHIPKDGTLYHGLGPNPFHARDRERQKNRLLKRLSQLGYTVALAPVPNWGRVCG